MKAISNIASSVEIQVFSKLTPKTLKLAKKLVSTCREVDKYETPIHWDCIENRKNPFTHEILCYIEQVLIGYIALYYFRDKEVEITIVVNPEYRQPKFFRLIWEQIKLTVHRNKIETDYYTFTVNQKDQCLIDLLKDAGANLTSQIYKLSLSYKKFQQHLPIKHQEKNILCRAATVLDTNALIDLECQCFGTIAKEYAENLAGLFLDPKQKIYVLVVKNKILGKIHFKVDKNEAFIFDFCIFPSEQHKGYGSILLQNALTFVLNEQTKKVFLETNTLEHLKWYTKLGFKETALFEHWKLYYPNFVKYHDQQYRMLVLNHYQEYDMLA